MEGNLKPGKSTASCVDRQIPFKYDGTIIIIFFKDNEREGEMRIGAGTDDTEMGCGEFQSMMKIILSHGLH